jgi:hypothetical protein
MGLQGADSDGDATDAAKALCHSLTRSTQALNVSPEIDDDDDDDDENDDDDDLLS